MGLPVVIYRLSYLSPFLVIHNSAYDMTFLRQWMGLNPHFAGLGNVLPSAIGGMDVDVILPNGANVRVFNSFGNSSSCPRSFLS